MEPKTLFTVLCKDAGIWRPANIRVISCRGIDAFFHIHYIGWADKWDEWVPLSSGRIKLPKRILLDCYNQDSHTRFILMATGLSFCAKKNCIMIHGTRCGIRLRGEEGEISLDSCIGVYKPDIKTHISQVDYDYVETLTDEIQKLKQRIAQLESNDTSSDESSDDERVGKEVEETRRYNLRTKAIAILSNK